jgi:hypothetical protein
MPTFAALIASVVSLAQGPLPTAVLPAPPEAKEVLVRVNGVEIRAGDVEALLWDWRGREVTGDLVTYHLVLGEAKRLNVQIPSEEIDREYERRLENERKRTDPGADLDETLRAQGYPKSRLYLGVHTELLVNEIAMREFRPEDFVKVSTVVFLPKSGKTAAERAAAVVTALGRGTTWKKAVADSDLEPEGKQVQGLLGWRALVAFPAAAQGQIRTLKAAGISSPVPMPDGSVQVFRVEMHGSEAKGPDAMEIREIHLSRARPALMQRLRSSAKIEKVRAGG